MKLLFKLQQYQLDAVASVVDCFKGQDKAESSFTLIREIKSGQGIQQEAFTEYAYRNRRIQLSPEEVLENIREVQRRNGLKVSPKLEGQYNLTIEMETGTGKTYTYIRTIFELNKQYGWNKFIVVVPSIAIREGVFKSFQITEDHFMEQYGKKARYFIYNSKQLNLIDQFASNNGIQVMIINSQAFNSRGKDARRIYMELDEFQSRKPIDILAQTRPILIIDEPQSVEGTKTKEALKLFNPLFTLRYSATHKEEYNKIYRLDALDAYNKKLVKKIYVKGINVKGTTGTDGYLYLEGIDISPKHAPVARLEYEIRTKSGIKKALRKTTVGDNLYELSGHLEQYKGYVVSEINAATNTIHFVNGVTLQAGDVQGDINESHFRRIQIRETIKSHFEKEKALYCKGIKVLSLFFIDEVAKYREYDDEGNPIPGEYARIFEEEYLNILNDYISNLFEDDYIRYLKSIDVKKTHNGYFSIDKKGRMVNPKIKANETDSDDEDAYQLIMRDKERLLSFKEQTRFIFSHSALREGWDNPNIFQICTLKHSNSTIRKRQEVGRGLRLCVNQQGERIDSSIPGIDVHEINVLTIIPSESYESFARGLQSEIAETLTDRPRKADIEFFLNKVLVNDRNEQITIDDRLARKIYHTFIRNDYLDDQDHLTETYYEAVKNEDVKVPDELLEYKEAIIDLVSQIYSEKSNRLVENDRKNNIRELKLNDNFYKKEFQELWKRINVKTAYAVDFDSDELVQKCITELDRSLRVTELHYQVKGGVLERIDSKDQLEAGNAFIAKESRSYNQTLYANSYVKYDLIGKLVNETKLTRKTITKILTGIKPATFMLFKKNPEEFILNAAKIINEQKASLIIEHITYNITDQTYDVEIFSKGNIKGTLGENTIEVKKHIYDYVIVDSKNEIQFAKDLDISDEVCVYAKLPKGFFIPSPVGNYSPDWAIVFHEGMVKHIYFIAETKGSMDSLELRRIEEAKIECAKKHFATISNQSVKYGVVDSYEELLKIVKQV